MDMATYRDVWRAPIDGGMRNLAAVGHGRRRGIVINTRGHLNC